MLKTIVAKFLFIFAISEWHDKVEKVKNYMSNQIIINKILFIIIIVWFASISNKCIKYIRNKK